MKSTSVVAVALTLAVASSGCATLFNGKMGSVMVQSRTPGASVMVDGMMAGQTPMVLPVTSDRPHTITVTGQGGQFTCVTTTSIGAVWIVLDILAGFVPILVDAVTGAWADASGDCFAPV